MGDETLRALGESGLLEALRKRIPAAEGVEIGPGDDAAALRTGPLTLASADLLLEGIHFELGVSSPADVGYKSVAVNVSDIAAMGGRARYALVSLGVPEDTRVAAIDALYDGMLEAAAEFGVALAGGDVSAAPRWLISVAILGEPGPGGIVGRGGARSGDVLCVTGSLGAAAAGLSLIRIAGEDPDAVRLLEEFGSLAQAHRRGRARAAEGIAVAAAGATAMIDVSDGLARDASHLAEESSLGLEIRASSVPLAPGVAEAAALIGEDPIRFALGGGEDYELAIAIPAGRVPSLAESIAPTPLTPVGEFAGGDRILLRSDGTRESLAELGWDHFA